MPFSIGCSRRAVLTNRAYRIFRASFCEEMPYFALSHCRHPALNLHILDAATKNCRFYKKYFKALKHE